MVLCLGLVSLFFWCENLLGCVSGGRWLDRSASFLQGLYFQRQLRLMSLVLGSKIGRCGQGSLAFAPGWFLF
ncbi:hypothetical protein B0T25DRAFT_525027 [Lasiosphaeria hispida]|uniref:Secreted protein n=1 Tax=Lasiosphaeria hispida TaxID=260671 RepID=A0AAJ0MJH9_9PEZI|nr:hypothetical protein B0T25DRAFT_525027 [Lasiosphaeria hispida]